VTVVAGISESHLTIHTWPEHGAALIDLFTCGDSADMLAILPDMVKRFGGSIEGAKWAMVPRGAKGVNDVYKFVLSRQHIGKKLLTSVKSKYQRIDIWQIVDGKEVDYDEEKDKDEDEKDKYTLVDSENSAVLFLDGVLQSSTNDEAVYHETLVHPGMIAHPAGAKRVAILGGGEGATLRECLKYTAVQEVVMVELDAEVMDQSRKHLAQMNNCTFSSPDGKFQSCFDEPRATIVNEDAAKWFRSKFGDDACKAGNTAEKFDVIILDLLDPEYLPDFEFAQELYSSAFFKELSCALNEDGVLIGQLGESPLSSDIDPDLKIKVDIMQRLSQHFIPQGTFVYETYVPSFNGAWSFAVACKSAGCANNWYGNAAAVDSRVFARLDDRVWLDSAASLDYFDGSVQEVFHTTPRGWQELFCTKFYRQQGEEIPPSCKALYGEKGYVAPASFDAATETHLVEVGAAAGSPAALVAARSIAKGEHLGVFGAATSLRFARADIIALAAAADAAGPESASRGLFLQWVMQHGQYCGSAGGYVFVSPESLLSFMSSDYCNTAPAPANVAFTSEEAAPAGGGYTWDPVILRNMERHCMDSVASKDIAVGDTLSAASSFADPAVAAIMQKMVARCASSPQRA